MQQFCNKFQCLCGLLWTLNDFSFLLYIIKAY
nr:MAG TPA: hypothetical protein [Caudoviricetes sp.]